jgi:hypothetical protein
MSKIKKIVKKICDDLDVEYIFKLPKEIQDLIFNIDSPLANFYKKFLTYHRNPNYDFFNTIDCPLHISDNDDLLTSYIPLELENKLAASKNAIDLFTEFDPKKIHFYTSCSTFLDQFKHYMKTEQRQNKQSKNFTNAWLKCWEMIHFYKLIPTNHSNDYTVFCNAEFPGAFIFAINHYIKTKTTNKNYNWFANSLWPGTNEKSDILGDSFGLYKRYRDHWLMNGQDASGDVTDRDMIRMMTKRLGKKVDLYTSDIGIDIPFDKTNEQESLEAHLNLGQVICALRTLKEGGNMVCKTFLFFKPMTLSLLYLLAGVFKEFSVSKPMTSRPGNSEIYLVGKGYKENVKVTEKLEDLLFHWDIKRVNDWIVPIPKYFYLEIVYTLYYIFQRQIYFLQKNIEFVKHEYKLSTTPPLIMDIFRRGRKDKNAQEINLRQQMVDVWKNKYPIGPIQQSDKL